MVRFLYKKKTDKKREKKTTTFFYKILCYVANFFGTLRIKWKDTERNITTNSDAKKKMRIFYRPIFAHFFS